MILLSNFWWKTVSLLKARRRTAEMTKNKELKRAVAVGEICFLPTGEVHQNWNEKN
jgi:hypothetical protein